MIGVVVIAMLLSADDAGFPGHVEASLGTGVRAPSAFVGLELRVRPIRWISAGITAGVGPGTTNPEIIQISDDDTVRNTGWTPWRWSASLMAHIPLVERPAYRNALDFTPRISLMRNPGAVKLHTDYPLCILECDSTVPPPTVTNVERPSGYFLSPALGITGYAGRIFGRVELGYSFLVGNHGQARSGYPIDTSKDPKGVSFGIAGGVAFL